MESFLLQPIGVIHTPFTGAENAPRQAVNSRAAGVVEVRPELMEGLDGIEAFPYIILIFGFHLAPAPEKLKVISGRDGVERGLFATRSPRRPNPLGLSTVRLLRREGCHCLWKAWTCWTARRCWISSLIIPTWTARKSGAERCWIVGAQAILFGGALCVHAARQRDSRNVYNISIRTRAPANPGLVTGGAGLRAESFMLK